MTFFYAFFLQENFIQNNLLNCIHIKTTRHETIHQTINLHFIRTVFGIWKPRG